MRGEWRSEPTWPAERLRPSTSWRPDGDERDRDRRARRRRDGCLDLVRREACRGHCRTTSARTTRSRSTYDWAARGRARAPRAPASSAHDHVAAPGRVPLRAALRRLPRRRLGPREPRRPQPHAPRRARRAEAARAGRADADRARARGDVLDLRGRPPRAARARGLGLAEHLAAASRRHARGRARHASSSSSPCSTAHRSSPPPVVLAAATGERDARRRRTIEQPPVVRLIEHDAVGRQTRVVTSYGSRYDGAATTRRSRSATTALVGVSDDEPGPRVGERANALLDRVAGGDRRDRGAPRASAPTSSAYHVVVEVVAAEDGPDGIGHVERRFERTIPRRLQ